MLLGEFHCTTDKDGKLHLPAQFCDELGTGLTLTRGIEKCLFIFPTQEWQRLTERMRSQLSLTNPDARAFTRLIFSAAQPCVPDQQGWIRLPGNLQRYAEIEDRVVVIGLYSHMEVWNPASWEKVKTRLADEGAIVAERLVHHGI